MNRSLYLTEALNKLEFNGKMNGLEDLFSKIEDVIFYLEAQGQLKAAEQLQACNWELKARMQYDREEQWLWTFVWMKDKVLRKLGVEANPSTSLRHPFDTPSTPLRQAQGDGSGRRLRAWVEVKAEVKAKVEAEVKDNPSANLRAKAEVELQVLEVQEFLESRCVFTSPHHLLIGQTWDRNTPLGIGSL
jgi:hypothetical protein